MPPGPDTGRGTAASLVLEHQRLDADEVRHRAAEDLPASARLARFRKHVDPGAILAIIEERQLDGDCPPLVMRQSRDGSTSGSPVPPGPDASLLR